METIGAIKDKLKNVDIHDILKEIAPYREDSRAGVQKIVTQAEKKYKAFLNELDRIESMKVYERGYPDSLYICGVDEAGRGPLCGPVVAGAVILPRDVDILYLDDSKKLSEKRRELLYDEIMEKAIAVGVGFGSVEVIDAVNILNATYMAMNDAIVNLNVRPDAVLVDAVTIPGLEMPQQGIVQGDSKSVNIAAASVIAKVTRDRMLVQYAELYPEYDLLNNKGYGTKKHIEALGKYGATPIHRRSFIRKFV